MNRRVLILGIEPSGASCTSSLIVLLQEYGWEPAYLDMFGIGGRDWVRNAWQACAAIFVSFNAVDDWQYRRLLALTAVGTPIIRWWVGTNVLRAVNEQDTRVAALRFSRVVADNVAVSGHLGTELRGIGMSSRTIGIPGRLAPAGPQPWEAGLSRAILVYLPEHLEDFYGGRLLDQLVSKRKDTVFYLLANSGKRYAGCGNVVPLDWTADMMGVYRKVGCLLRITEHDGLPRMIQEALMLGKYVIYSWPLDGCFLATDLAEVHTALSEVAGKTEANLAGKEAWSRLFSPDAFSRSFTQLMAEASTKRCRVSCRAWTLLPGTLVRKCAARET